MASSDVFTGFQFVKAERAASVWLTTDFRSFWINEARRDDFDKRVLATQGIISAKNFAQALRCTLQQAKADPVPQRWGVSDGRHMPVVGARLYFDVARDEMSA
jgi:hypothetical protein